MNEAQLETFCQKCGGRGMTVSTEYRPAWCTCKGIPGPFVAPPGVTVCFKFRSNEDILFRERCRLLGNAERQARDSLCGRFVRCGTTGYRELPKTSRKRMRLEEMYLNALRALEEAQQQCVHPERSMYNHDACGICYKSL